jgi:hypothetical protein
MDPILATLVNKEGVLQVGNKAYRFFREKFIIIENPTASKLNKVGKNTYLNENEGIIEGTITYNKIGNSNVKNGKTSNSITCIQEYRTRGGIGGIKKRMVGDIDYANYSAPAGYFYVSVVVATKHQQRILGVWAAKNTNYVSVNATFNVPINGGGSQNSTLSDRRDGQGYCEVSIPGGCIEIYTGNPNRPYETICDDLVNTVNSYHESRVDNGDTKRCNQTL